MFQTFNRAILHLWLLLCANDRVVESWGRLICHLSIFRRFVLLLKTNFEQSKIKDIITKQDINEANEKQEINEVCDQTFPERKIRIKPKSLVSPWIT